MKELKSSENDFLLHFDNVEKTIKLLPILLKVQDRGGGRNLMYTLLANRNIYYEFTLMFLYCECLTLMPMTRPVFMFVFDFLKQAQT